MDEINPRLLGWLASVNKDPEAFVRGAFPWSEPGTVLEKETGPNEWQLWVLRSITTGLISMEEAIQIAVASGHGVGKSTLVSWVILWAFSTAPDTRGTITANTESQLKTKTWAEVGKWFNLFIAKDFFQLTATALLSKDPSRERTWRIDAVPWSEKNPEAFAGLHNKGKRLLLVMDEASGIFDTIWETAEGALTDADTEIIWLAFGNPTRNDGRFRECFPGGKFAKQWSSRSIDSREVPQSNKKQLQKWIDAYGEDSDFVRVRVKGQFPLVGEMEFFSVADIETAATREIEPIFGAGLALGVDVARYGKNSSVLYYRRGRDARTIPRQRYQGLSTVQVSEKILEGHHTHRPDGIMIDGGGVGGGVVDQVRHKQLHCYEVQFGAKDDTPHITFGSAGERYANKRSGMYGALRAWLKTGAIPNDPEFLAQFKGIKYVFNKQQEIQLISKEDMLRLNPDAEFDDIDALALTFSNALVVRNLDRPDTKAVIEHEYNPFDPKHMEAA